MPFIAQDRVHLSRGASTLLACCCLLRPEEVNSEY
ncbi:TPA: hypothetical protein ACG6UX_003130 [Escherichia coli]